MSKKYTIGLDYGTDSVRALVVDTQTGENVGTAVHYYERWKNGLFCNPSISQFRQHPLDYLEGLESAIKGALEGLSDEIKKSIVGISIDTTGSTPVAVDKKGTPLALLPEFSENPNGMFILWKDHTANTEAEEINQLAHTWSTDFTKYVGGIYSSEWFWAKILRTLRVDAAIREKAFSWVEHCDWISAVLTGNTNPLTLKRSRCAAGHKAMWHQEFEGLPSEEFLTKLDPLLTGLRERLFSQTYTSNETMGIISKEWAIKLGLPEDVSIGVGAFDCHMGAVGAEIEPYDFVRVMGTSTCDMLIAPNEEIGHLLIRGICGQVDGSIIPNMLGMEAGQSAYGDYYAWFQKIISEPVRELLGEKAADELVQKLIPYLSEKASLIPITENDPVATDWINGRRTPDANHELKAAFMGLNLGTDAIKLFKMIVEATAFGSKAIVDRFIEEGVPIKQVIAIGGVAKKSPFVMQTLSDVLNMPIKVASSDQACALGAAMNASVAAGVHANLFDAQKAMGSGFDARYEPRPNFVEVYQKLYRKYQSLGKFIEKNA
ncbi:L-ribulokinase (plasmid) [Emticicia oligotrophica DSM 17448]|uniref:Ribulokinase n=1 Tax=Emticicia oligotrophica (strain DSM 17448 / CIP 109782 / MTCC 6937 / GPTSA100-15) TaxID=929562 RepID=A0ABN4AX82_EMTOG|nr:ribulokinase [Emticicia oligotrophica]AFK05652.1 L-ribulokinase [Emticicia oligotrophica DSM 17448]